MDIEKILTKMTLKEKIGQLFQIGFSGTSVTPAVKEMIESYHIGGIIYFVRNIKSPEQLAVLSKGLQEIVQDKERGIPLLISTDQEGGTVTRLVGGTHFPGNMALGATRDAGLAYKAGRAVARELKAVGINMNLAPVLDVNINPANPVIGVRSYGEDPELVAELGTAYIDGMQQEDVIACGKHFPGHGDTNTDSHLALPVIKHKRERLEKIEFYPFKKAIANGIDSIMTAHVYFPAIESEKGIPATLSSNVLTGLLREDLGFNGLIITDCMEMNAIVSTFGTVEGAVMTIEGGSDTVLISHSIEKAKAAINAIMKAVKEKRISEKRIDQSVMRILRLKEKRIGLRKNGIKFLEPFSKEEGHKVAYQIAKKAVTIVRNKDGLIPIRDPKEKRVLLLDFNIKRVALVENNKENKNCLVDYLKDEGLDLTYYSLSEQDMNLPPVNDFDLVIYCTYDAVHNPGQLDLMKRLKQTHKPVIVIALRNPYDLKVLPEVRTFITTYDYSPANLKVASEIIVGKYKAQGRLPVSI